MTHAAPPPTAVLRRSAAPRYAFAAFDAPDADAHQAARDAHTAALAAARAEGHAAGTAQARAHAEASADALRAEIAALTDRLADAEAQAADVQALASAAADRLAGAWGAAVRALEPTLAAFALSVADGVLDAPLTDAQQEAATRALAEAVDALAADAPATVALHPVDLLRLQETGLADALAATHAGLRWEADAHLAPGDWTVETPDAAVHRLRGPMLDALRDRLGLPADGEIREDERLSA